MPQVRFYCCLRNDKNIVVVSTAMLLKPQLERLNRLFLLWVEKLYL